MNSSDTNLEIEREYMGEECPTEDVLVDISMSPKGVAGLDCEDVEDANSNIFVHGRFAKAETVGSGGKVKRPVIPGDVCDREMVAVKRGRHEEVELKVSGGQQRKKVN